MEMDLRETGLGPLATGGRVIVVGGGPGGTATAIALRLGGQAMGREVRVTIVEGKHFSEEQHHNQCAGVFSPPVTELIERELGIPFPHSLCRGVIRGYVLHSSRREIVLDGPGDESVAMRRIQFDDYMLQAARELGVEVVSARLTGLEFHADRVVVYTESEPLEADVIVGAFGLDEGAAALFREAVGYQPPPALNAIVTKYHPGEAEMLKFGQRIHAFLPPSKAIEFGAVSPKGNHLTINIAGTAVDANVMDAFLAMPNVRQVLPKIENARSDNPGDLRYFKGQFPCGLARNFSGERFVLVGDAAGLVRAFKGKGVTSAIQTGMRAAEVILKSGISSRAFQVYHEANRDILDDLPYGQAMRRLTILGSRLGLMDVVLQAAGENMNLRRALFDAVSAHRPYREVVKESFSVDALGALARAMGGSVSEYLQTDSRN